jgi:hypothetical protein
MPEDDVSIDVSGLDRLSGSLKSLPQRIQHHLKAIVDRSGSTEVTQSMIDEATELALGETK